jgi:hypothetical protein
LEANTQKTQPPTTNRKKISAIIVSVAVIALAVGLTGGLLITSQNPPSTQNTENTQSAQNGSWMAIGDYAVYSGQADVLSTTVTFNARMEITGLNDTSVQISTDTNMSTPFGSTENATTTWESRENMTFLPDGFTQCNSTYTSQITLPNIGTRSCTVYVYQSQELTATYYVDNEFQWPLKMTMSSPEVEGLSYSIDVNLVETNIPGL